MKTINLKKTLFIAILISAAANFSFAQAPASAPQVQPNRISGATDSSVKERNVRAQMEFLASDALSGRGSGTQFERLAAQYIGSQLQQFGVEAAGEIDASSGAKTYVQSVSITRNAFIDAPKISYIANGAPVVLEHGKEMLVARLNAAQISGALQKMTLDEKPKPGSIAFVRLREGEDASKIMQNVQSILSGGAAAVIVEEMPAVRADWANLAARKISFTSVSGSAEKNSNASGVIVLSKEAANALAQIADGTSIEIKGALGEPQKQQTWNAVGKIEGSDARLAPEVVLLSAHLDHLGVRDNAPGADKIFNGADDDASGCVAVLELARVLGNGQRPKRSVYFAFFGSEEAGGYGAQYFVNNLPFPKENLAANLEFEMIGRPDAKVAADELWLTGYERSNLGAELAKRGAKLVADPHPEENFFQRSDNYTLAKAGVVAHTVSSFGLHKDYHKATDEVKTIDFGHMTRAIGSMVKSVEWLVNSDFKPVWFEGKKP